MHRKSRSSRWCAALWLFSAVGCGDDVAGAAEGSTGDEPTTTADDASSSAAESTTSALDAADDTEATTDATTGDTTGDETTGARTGEELELLVTRADDDGWYRIFDYRRVDDEVEGPTQLVPDDDAHWTKAAVFPGRRVVFQVQDAVGHDVRLGSLDVSGPGVQLDVAPVEPGPLSRFERIADEEAIVFVAGDSDAAFRIDFPAGVPQTPVLVAPGLVPASGGIGNLAVDPVGRWISYSAGSPFGVGTEVALAALDAPDPEGAVVLTAILPGQFAVPEAFSSDGASLFYSVWQTTRRELYHVDVRDDAPGVPTLVHEPIGPSQSIVRTVRRDVGDGIAYLIADDTPGGESLTLWFAAVDGGVPQPAVALLEDMTSFGSASWSPDGSWLEHDADQGGTNQQYLVHVGDGSEPPASFLLEGMAVDHLVFAPDSQSVYIAHHTTGQSEIGRMMLTDDGPGLLQPIVQSNAAIVVGRPEDFTASGDAMLLTGRFGEQSVQCVVDLSGVLPGVPVVVNGPLAAGTSAELGTFSPGGDYVIYVERAGIFGQERLMLGEIVEPGAASEVMADVGGWQVVRAE